MTGADLGTQAIFERETNLFEEDFEENEWEFLSLVNEDFDFPTATRVFNNSELKGAHFKILPEKVPIFAKNVRFLYYR